MHQNLVRALSSFKFAPVSKGIYLERGQEKESWNGRGETSRKGKTCFLIKEGGGKEKTQEGKPKGRKQVCGEKTQKW